MKLLSIDIQNFRLHAATSIDFSATGITGIVGSNETGKSTILEALLWAFYGGEAIRGTKAGVRWFRAPEKSPAAVLVCFELKGIQYMLSRSESTATLHIVKDGPGGGDMLAEGTAAVNKYIPGLLGMSHGEFVGSFLVKQKDVDRIAMMLPTERQTFIREVLGVGKLDDAVVACRKRKNEIGQEVTGMKATLGERDPHVEALGDAVDAAEALSVAFNRAEEKFATKLHASEEADEEFCKSLTAYEHTIEIERQISEAKAHVGRHAQTRAKLATDLERMDTMKEALAAATDEFEPVPILEERVNQTRDAAEVAVSMTKDLKALRQHDQARHDGLAIDLTSKAADIKTTILAIEHMGADSGCPTCTVPLGDNYKRVWDGLHVARDTLLEEAADHTIAVGELGEMTEQELKAQSESVTLSASLHNQNLVLHAARERDNKLAEIRGKIAREEEIKSDLAVTDGFLKDVTTLVNQLTADLTAMGFDPDVHAKLAEVNGAALDAKVAAQTEHARVMGEMAGANNLAVRCQKALESYDKLDETLQDATAKQLVHEKAAARLADFRTSVAGTIRPELEELMSGFVHLLTDGRHEAVELTEDFTAVLYEAGIALEVVSGGTEDIAALAMRLSISQMIAERAGHPLSLLILDEPFGSQDENRRGNILTLLRTLSGVFSQVIVISHIAETRDAADHIIELEHDELAGCTRVVA